MRYSIADLAQRDLDGIWLHIARENVEAADSVIDTFLESFLTLARHPEMGRERREIVEGILCFPVFKTSWRSRFLVFYRAVPEGIEVARVLEGHLDVVRFFEGE